MNPSQDHRATVSSCPFTDLARLTRGTFGTPANNGAAEQGEREAQQTFPSLTDHSPQATETRPYVTEMVLTCSPQLLEGMVAAYQTAIEDAAGDLPMQLLWWGQSRKYGHGILVLEWSGQVSEAFLHDLAIDEEVFDYLLYEDDRVVFDLQQPEASTQATTNVAASPASERSADQ